MFDTESEDEEEPDVRPVTRDLPVRQRKMPVMQQEAPAVDEIQNSIMDMSEFCTVELGTHSIVPCREVVLLRTN